MSATHVVKSYLLRRALQFNAGFSLLSGLVLTLAPRMVGNWLGVHLDGLYIAMGAVLILFGVGLLRNARRLETNLSEAKLASALDVLWVLGSAVVIALPGTGLSVSGKWLMAIVADVVALFALLQWLGLRRLRG